MSIDYDNRERKFNAGIETSFRALAVLVKIEVEDILELVTAIYRQDLQALDARVRILDDVVAIVNIGDADAVPEEKYRKIRAALVGKGLISDD